jgi:tryptophanyl-tRNA synthetase
MKYKKRILTGDRPTGQLHLGHYVGSLQNRVKLQDKYECFFIIADLQVLTDHLNDYEEIEANVYEVMLDYLASGLHPEHTFFVQSQVPELAELTTYFSFLVNLARVQRNPTVKEEAKMYGISNMSFGFIGYPISQAADILGFKAHLVPVGQDQLPHIEQTREIARRFNQIFKREVFPIPEPLIGDCPVLLGIDGENKMSKSLDNFITFAHSPEETKERILNMVTDRKRPYRKDPGHPDECSAFKYWCLFAPTNALVIRQECETAARGCKECKIQLAQAINEHLAEIRERRRYYASQPELIWDVLSTGTKQARKVCIETLREVREAMRLSYPKLKGGKYADY